MAGLNPIQEIALHFGAQQRLIGVLSLPPPEAAPRIAVVMANTGLDPRPGPNRLHVHLARALAARGHMVLRMDLGGLGDSDLPTGESADAVRDLSAGLDVLAKRGCGPQFAVIGDCSGAHDAYRLALADARISSCVFIDGYVYDTPRHVRNRLGAKLLRAPRKITELLQHGLAGPDAPATEVGFFTSPPQAEAAAGYAALKARGVRMAFVFSGDIARDYSYPEQHEESFPALRGAVTVWHLKAADHTFTRRAARTDFIQRVGEWLSPG